MNQRTYPLDLVAPWPTVLARGAVTIGNFDGVHRGHTTLIEELHRHARRLGGPAVAITFDPHPLRLLAPEQFMPQLTTVEDRAEYLLAAGADRVGILQTTPDLLRLEPVKFLDAVVRDRLKARFIVEGFNFRFGRDRAGDFDLLEKWCPTANVGCVMVQALTTPDGVPISSSRVRTALDAGDIAAANDLLGRRYRLRGKIIAGARRGASLGFPTANLSECPTVIPGDGVYAALATTTGGTWPAAVNIGPNPTFGETARKVEAHLLDFKGDLYGQEIALDFTARLRDTKPFASQEKLASQLREDVERARAALQA